MNIEGCHNIFSFPTEPVWRMRIESACSPYIIQWILERNVAHISWKDPMSHFPCYYSQLSQSYKGGITIINFTVKKIETQKRLSGLHNL